ncbi:sigma-54-dependent transcriptional regulator [Nocardia sp. CA-290969]|uniref:sigma-54-dependent transcriptional regulator n=1 Tax=Nocardia sp. CA-290969 TaxID=3239986 RepID=UPI003D8A57E8
MPWIAELRPDAETNQVARELASFRNDLAADVDGLGLLICSATSSATDILQALRDTSPDSRVIVVHVGHLSVDPWAELAMGADDVLQWDADPEPIRARLYRIGEVEQIIDSAEVRELIVGRSAALRLALRELVTAALFGTGPILISGETGTGKELAARVAHRVGRPTSTGHLVVVDCTTVVAGLLGSELFGHERGAFTGAVAARTGAFAAADGGTLFLDEIGELPLELQPEFLRVLQEGTYKRIGGDRWQRSDFRLICATNRDVLREVDEGRFRSDLYYRIAASAVSLPPLRERGEDILDLFGHFYAEACGGMPKLDVTVARALREREYPGNLRDLRQLARRVAARHVGSGPITPGDLPPVDRPRPDPHESTAGCPEPGLAAAVRAAVAAGATLRQLRDQVADLAVDTALAHSDGNVRAAAARLGVTDRALHLRRARARDGIE